MYNQALRGLVRLTITITICALPATSSVQGQCVDVCGDVDGNGLVNPADVVALASYTHRAQWIGAPPARMWMGIQASRFGI
jgi:hypothetical protein